MSESVKSVLREKSSVYTVGRICETGVKEVGFQPRVTKVLWMLRGRRCDGRI